MPSSTRAGNDTGDVFSKEREDVQIGDVAEIINAAAPKRVRVLSPASPIAAPTSVVTEVIHNYGSPSPNTCASNKQTRPVPPAAPAARLQTP